MYFQNSTRGSPEYLLLKKYQIRNNIYHTHTRHGYSGVANLVKVESFHSYKQINFRNRIVDHNNPINKPFRNVT